MTIKCYVCQKKINRSPYDVGICRRPVCGIKCRGLLFYKSKKLKCALCKKTIYRTQRRIDKFKQQFCSIACRSKVIQSMRGEKSVRWKGGVRIIHGRIRRFVPNHPFADKRGCVFEHRLVMEKKLGRILKRDEIVHHINEIPTDNRIENLQVMTRSEHMKLHQNLRH